ncbi:MAG: DsbA family protein [Proteobacteria bacterium]|nr:DsbA family protein [Pseudomonadota bacterium]
MKKIYLGVLSFATLGFTNGVLADNPPATAPVVPAAAQSASSNFTPAQVAEMEKVIGSYLEKNPDIIMTAMQAGMAKQQKEAAAKMEKAVAENKDKIFKVAADPVAGNPEGKQRLVVFWDPSCGFCKKFHGEIATLLSTNKDVKVIFKDLPIMGDKSVMAIKALLAAKEQSKYEPLQKAVFESTKPLSKKQLLKMASSLGIDTKKLKIDMESKAVQAQVDAALDLAKTLGITGTPTLIIGETKVVPGYVKADELEKMLKEAAALPPVAADSQQKSGQAS